MVSDTVELKNHQLSIIEVLSEQCFILRRAAIQYCP
jgi:hypothetical protein